MDRPAVSPDGAADMPQHVRPPRVTRRGNGLRTCDLAILLSKNSPMTFTQLVLVIMSKIDLRRRTDHFVDDEAVDVRPPAEGDHQAGRGSCLGQRAADQEPA